MESLRPTPTDIRNVIDGLCDGTAAYAEWMRRGALPDEAFTSELYWVNPCENNFQHDVCACGHTPGEAAAAAFVDAILDGEWWVHGVRPLTDEEFARVPLTVPAGWEFDVHAVPANSERRQ